MKKLMLLMLLLLFSTSVSALSIDGVEVVPSRVSPGNSANIRLQIENEENFDVNNVLIKLDLSSEFLPIAPIGSGTEKFILEIEDEDSEYVYFDVVVLAFAPLGVYKIPVVITYEENGEIIIKNEMISLEVYASPELDVLISGPDFLVGYVSEIEFEIINKGLSDVNFLNIILKESSFYNILTSSEIYVGELDSDDSDKVSFKLQLNYPTPSQISFPIVLEYEDSNNLKITKEFIVKKKIYSFDEAVKLGLISEEGGVAKFFLIILFVILFFGYRKFKKKRKK
jgi:hypothetical protein